MNEKELEKGDGMEKKKNNDIIFKIIITNLQVISSMFVYVCVSVSLILYIYIYYMPILLTYWDIGLG